AVRRTRSSLTDKAAALEALKASQAQLAFAAEAANIGLWDWNTQTGKTWFSRKWAEQLGLETHESDGHIDTWLSFLHPDDRQLVHEVLQSHLTHGARWTVEFRMRTHDAGYQWFRAFGKATKGDGDAPVHIAGATLNIAEEKARQEEIHRIAQSLSRAQTIAKLGSWDWDIAQNSVLPSDELCRIFGIDPEGPEATHAGFRSRIHPDDIERVDSAIRCALDGQAAYDVEFRVLPVPGEDKAIICHAVGDVVRDDEGRPVLFTGTSQDITKRKQLEDELKHRTEEAEMILNHAPVRIWFKDDENRILRANRAAADSMGLTVEEAEGSNTADHFPTLAAQYHADDMTVIASGEPMLDLVEPYAPAGRPQGWSRTNKVPYCDPETGKRFIFVASIDITAERMAQDAEHATAERYRLLYKRTPAMMHSVDRDGILVAVSNLWLEKLGYRREDVIGRPASDFLTPESAHKAVTDALVPLRQTGACKDVDLQFVTRTGEILDTQLSAVTQHDESGEISGTLAVMTDVSERRVIERRLIQAQKMEAVGQLTGGMAHDFNNLLSVIVGNLELLELAIKSDPQASHRARSAMNAAERGALLTQRLLAFSRRQALETKTIDVNELVGSMSNLLRRTLGETIELQFNPDDDLWSAHTDPGQLESAVLNLAINARDAMPRGGHLIIETRNTHLDQDYANQEVDVEPGDYVHVTVSDTGTGIPAEILDKVFDPFFTTKEVGKGTGLGLSMVLGFVKQSGGHVKIYSEDGNGTTVNLYLRRAEAAADTDAMPSGIDQNCADGAGTILLVEDQDSIREFAQDMLEELGYHVLAAENGLAALAVLDANPSIDLLLTDIVMPGGLSGPQLARLACERRPDLRLLYMSGFAESKVLLDGEVELASDLIHKPFRRAELARKVHAAMTAPAKSDRPRRAVSG
ncbi:MAG: PAS domain S-box protein, partial [Rhodospirillaceae bacterium]|nr:PAS domain S-box protein [Rhodospirillaceae bacterium]